MDTIEHSVLVLHQLGDSFANLGEMVEILLPHFVKAAIEVLVVYFALKFVYYTALDLRDVVAAWFTKKRKRRR